jgi:hypothetical protein
VKLLTAVLWLWAATCLPSQVRGDRDTAPDSKLPHFAKVDDGVYKGSKPKSDADFRFLQSLRVKYR